MDAGHRHHSQDGLRQPIRGQVGYNPHKPGRPSHAYHTLESAGGWGDCGQGFEGIEGELQLTGWSRKRRVIVARRRIKPEEDKTDKATLPLLTRCGKLPMELISYEYIVLTSTLPYKVRALVALYRERGDAENPFDELKNQWGWAGFTTQDLNRCQVTARLIAQTYNWRSLYARLVDRERHREAVTTRPELIGNTDNNNSLYQIPLRNRLYTRFVFCDFCVA